MSRAPIDVALRCDLPVGVVRWTSSPRRLTVIVKASLDLRGGGAWLSGHHAALSHDRPSPHSPHELAEASDFAPYKPRADVMLTGSAHAEGLVWAIPITIRVGSFRRELFACTDAPRRAIPLTERYLRDGTEPTAEPTRVGPRSPGSPERRTLAEEPFDWAFFNAAPREQQIESIAEDAEIELTGLIAGAPRASTRLPAMRPRVHLVDGRRIVGPVAVFCDTLVIDTDRAVLSLTWRGVAEIEGVARPSLLVGCGAAADQPTDKQLYAELSDATWTIAAEAPDDDDAAHDGDAPSSHGAPPAEEPPRPAPQMRLGASFRLGGAPPPRAEAPAVAAVAREEQTQLTAVRPPSVRPVTREEQTQIATPRRPSPPPVSHEDRTQIAAPRPPSVPPLSREERALFAAPSAPVAREDRTLITSISDEPTGRPDLLPFARAPHPIAPPPLLPTAPLPAFTRPITEPPPPAFARPITEPPPPIVEHPPVFARPITEPPPPAFARPITEPPPPIVEPPPVFARPITEPPPPIVEAPAGPRFVVPEHVPTQLAAPPPAWSAEPSATSSRLSAALHEAPLGGLSIETYAAIQAAVFARAPLAEALSAHGLDEHAFRVGAARLMHELSVEARAGRHDRMLLLSEEIRRRTTHARGEAAR